MTGQVRASRWRRAASRALLAFALAFAWFFGGFSLATTGILFLLFLVDPYPNATNFPDYFMLNRYYLLYLAFAATAAFIGALWFVATLVSNLRFNEGQTNRMIDRWLEKMNRSARSD